MGFEKVAVKLAKSDTKIFAEIFKGKAKVPEPLRLDFSKTKLSELPPEQKVDRIQVALDEARVKHLEKIKLQSNPLSKIKSMAEPMERKATRKLTEDFASKKQRLLQELQNVCDKSVIARIEKADTPEKLAKILVKQDLIFYETWLKQILKGSAKFNKNRTLSSTSLQMEQLLYEAKVKRAEFVLARERALHVPSQNQQVIAIENILKEQYGVKFVSLKDNETLARNVLRACETASKNGIEIPKNIISSDFLHVCGEHYPNSTILLKPNPYIVPGRISTSADYHIPLHEILHGEQLELVAFNFKKIPTEFLPVKQNLSGYSAKSSTHETFVELYTKKLVDGLNPEEEKLFNYLNILG